MSPTKHETPMLHPVVLGGGSGTRLWPLSRQSYPKQFHPLVGENTMLQETILRLEGLDCGAPLLVCHEEHRFLAAEQMRLIGKEAAILLEPEPRNTAPAIALAALHASAGGADPLLLVLAADHVIRDRERFHTSVVNAIPFALQGRLVAFGIVPDSPNTGYGYIRRGAPLGEAAFEVSRFEEKPDQETAERYLQDGGYYWNGGMFLFRASSYLDELRAYAPDILEACSRAIAARRADSMGFIRVDATAMRACPSISIDYAVMEKTKKAAVVPLDAGWDDVGSWSTLLAMTERDAEGNALAGDIVSLGSRDTLVRAQSRLVAILGVQDLVIVETKDAVLVAHRDRVQEVKQLVELMRDRGRPEYLTHREVYRPWGSYDSIEAGPRHQVKRITVKPGAKLSLQMHHHRAEHWVVVRGTAKVVKGDETIMLTENQSTYISPGERHSLENPGKIPLEVIEIQSGSYLGEDDIVRFEDRYGRS